ncbi:LysR family transcriptional regulator [Dehalobacterium formicoaceticum]|uniref:LysR family transcriptional regulator n=1 Tax=Dehalobacterium formicoaceticum TaxID=51515 RepID=A0ABT1Y1Y6_9FIRM|nr:LysR family transcriptional regulator [Dehalobacterium formicoaceticum]MCR6544881.1 LysR family transcriptional regulator [Dehalobacterium formicoaceticum]
MNERKLRVFYEVATKLNMTEVANQMFISQPAISQTIRDLEDDFGIQFFDRIGKKLYLTHEGDLFLNYVRRILNLYDDCYKTIKDNSELKNGKLRIGASTTIGIYLLPEIIGKFYQEHKEIEVSIVIENTKIIADMILKNQIDFAFVEGPVFTSEIQEEYFCDDELVLITPPSHPWAQLEEVDLKELENAEFIMREQGSGTREIFEEALKDFDINYEIKFELGNTEAIKKAVEANLGVSCVSRKCVAKEAMDGSIAVRNIKGLKIMREFQLIHHKDKYFSKLFSLFIDFCRNHVQKEGCANK